jgi:2-polyprenyl-6-methoxyphenol hydroxylase-like FAD-dependent oxidoreductase
MTEAEIIEAFNIPGLNVEASLEPREIELFFAGVREIERRALARAAAIADACVIYDPTTAQGIAKGIRDLMKPDRVSSAAGKEEPPQ